MCVADRGPASRAGAFAALQAGDGEARSQPQLLLRAGRLQQQDQGGGAGARGQEAQAGTAERFTSCVFAVHSSLSILQDAEIISKHFHIDFREQGATWRLFAQHKTSSEGDHSEAAAADDDKA